MRVKNLKNLEILSKDFKLSKTLPLNGNLKVIKPLSTNKWLVAFLGKKLEISSNLPLKSGFNYKARLFKNEKGKLEIQINFDSIYKELKEFDSRSKVLFKKDSEFFSKIENSFISEILSNVKDEFTLKLLFTLQFEDLSSEEFYEIYEYLENGKSEKNNQNKIPIFIENNDEFIIALPFLFLDSNGLFFLFSKKGEIKVNKWSFVSFLTDKEKFIAVFNKSKQDRTTELLIYSDININDIIEELKADLLEFNIGSVRVVNSTHEFDDFNYDLVRHKGINLKV